MAENKTKKTSASAEEFIESVDDDRRRKDACELLELMRRVTGEEPRMWGPSIVGFGDVHYMYESGREGDWFKVGFSPRKTSLTLYMMSPSERRDGYLDKLGKHRTGKGCVYINKLDDVDTDVLAEMISDAVEAVEERYGES